MHHVRCVPRKNIFGFHPLTGPIRRKLAAHRAKRALTKAGSAETPEKKLKYEAKAIAAAKNPSLKEDPNVEHHEAAGHDVEPMLAFGPGFNFCRTCRMYIPPSGPAYTFGSKKNPSVQGLKRAGHGMFLYHGYLIYGSKGEWLICENKPTPIPKVIGPFPRMEAALLNIDWLNAAPKGNPTYPAIRGKAFERRYERMVLAIKKKGGAASPWAVATARLGGYPASRAARNPMSKRERESFDLFLKDPAAWIKKYPKQAARLRREIAQSRKNPSKKQRWRLARIRDKGRTIAARHQRAMRVARRSGRFASGFARGAFPEVARPAAGLKAGLAAARRNPAKASSRYLALAQTYLGKGAYRSADDFISKALRAASPGSMEEIRAVEMQGRLRQALLDRVQTGPSRMWERMGKNPQVSGSTAVEIVYKEPNGQLWRHRFTEDEVAPKLKVKKGRKSDQVLIGPTTVTKAGIGDPQ